MYIHKILIHLEAMCSGKSRLVVRLLIRCRHNRQTRVDEGDILRYRSFPCIFLAMLANHSNRIQYIKLKNTSLTCLSVQVQR
jgi:hypothetical protein